MILAVSATALIPRLSGAPRALAADGAVLALVAAGFIVTLRLPIGGWVTNHRRRRREKKQHRRREWWDG
jgi:hypothetical protein